MAQNFWKTCAVAGWGSFAALMFFTMFRQQTFKLTDYSGQIAGGPQTPGSLQTTGLQTPGSLPTPGSLQTSSGPQTPGSIQTPDGLQTQDSLQTFGNLQTPVSLQTPGSLQNPGSLHMPGSQQTQTKKVYAENEDYANTYSKRYHKGYNANYNFSHEHITVRFVREMASELRMGGKETFRRFVVLGCSHGLGAAKLQQEGYLAWGVDVSPEAIEMATSRRGRTCGPGSEPCFVRASLTNLPYADGQFDAGMSADVFEHLLPVDIPRLVEEVSRVVQHYLFLQIAAGPDGDSKPGEGIHRTQKGPKWWIKQFAKAGWRVHKDYSKTHLVKGTVRLILLRGV